MISLPRRWFRLLLLAAFVGPLSAQSVRSPEHFEWVLWCADLAKGSALAHELGYTAVQVGRGVDPAPATSLGLRYYLDQPIGKGLLELRDAEWQAVAQAYERTRDPAVLVRPGCFAAPGAIDGAAAAAVEEVLRVRGPGLSFVALADEPSATRHDAPLDTCRCADCMAAFRRYAEQRFGTIDAYNSAMGTACPSFAEAQPLTTDQLRRRELGDVALPRDLRAFAIWLDFVDAQYADAVTSIVRQVQAAVPTVPVGLTGLGAPAAFGGGDFARLLPSMTLAEPYPLGGAVELARCLLPAKAHRYATLSPPPSGPAPMRSLVQAELCNLAAHGLAGVVVWNDGTVGRAEPQPAEGSCSAFGDAVRATKQRFGMQFDTCAGATVLSSSVWLVESQASVRAWWMVDSANDGLTWVRRLASYENTHSTSQAARRAWSLLLQDLGLQPYFVAESTLPERLLRERPRCLVLPASLALADRTVQAITAYVDSGGTLLADHSAAIYDGDLRRRDRGALDRLFGVDRRSLDWADLLVREGKSTSRQGGLPLAERALHGSLGEAHADGDAFLEHASGRGRAIYLNAPVVDYASWRLDVAAIEPAGELRRRVRSALMRAGVRPDCEVYGAGWPTCIERVPLRVADGRLLIVVRMNALDSPQLLQQLGAEGPRAITVEFAGERAVRLLGGQDLGRASRFELRLDPFAALFLEVGR